MDFAKLWKKHRLNVLKGGGLLLLVLAVLSVASVFSDGMRLNKGFGLSSGSSTSFPGIAQESARYAANDMAESIDSYAPGRTVISPIPPITPPAGSDAEEFEVTEYRADVRTRTLTEDCQKITALKSDPDIIFESANEYDKGCSYAFKATKDRAESVLALIKSLDPEDLAENTYTIQRTLETLTSEQEILERKMTSIEETLEDAITSYDQIIALANETQDAETLATVIESKLRIIESLTQQRLNTREQLDRLLKAKADQMDRLAYTFFYITIVEDKYVDVDDLKDSWKLAVQNFVSNFNEILQALTVGLIALIFFAAQYVIYFFLLLLIAKFVWKWTKQVWGK